MKTTTVPTHPVTVSHSATSMYSAETQEQGNLNQVTDYDLVVIGAGPAGMAATTTAHSLGLRVALLDEQPSPGGQIYRAIGHTALADEQILGPDYYAGRDLFNNLEQSLQNDQQEQGQTGSSKTQAPDYFPGSMVWSIEKDLTVCFSQQDSSKRFRAKKILIATGAMERPVPFPGWTLPGVMTCGSAQILLKQSALAPETPLVIAGSGPLLLLIAAQLHRAGVEISAVLDTTPKGRYRKAIKYIPGALKNIPLLKKGLDLLQELKQAGIRYEKHVTGLKALSGNITATANSPTGNNSGVSQFDPSQAEVLDQVEYQINGQKQHLPCRTLLVHQGVVPNVQLSRSLQLDHQWNPLQLCWTPTQDSWGASSNLNIYIAGDGGGIAGAKAAEYQGKLAALKIANLLGKLTKAQLEQESTPFRKSLQQQEAIRPFLDQIYQPIPEFLTPEDDTVVCRCEEITAGEIRQIAAKGIAGPNQAKAFCRSGMGPCQGRMCGLTVSNLIADTQNKAPEQVGYYQIRSPIKPLTLDELADLAE